MLAVILQIILKEFLEKHDQGVHVVDLVNQYVSIKAITPAKAVKIFSKQWASIHENMEELLIVGCISFL